MSNRPPKHTVVGLGEILWDMLPGGKQLGGAPANFAFHAKALGLAGIPASCVGDDSLGREILDALDRMALEKRYIAIDSEHPTGTVTVKLDEKGKPDYIIHENTAWDYIPITESLLSLAAGCQAVCFGSLCQRSVVSRQTIRLFLGATRDDCIRIFDINLRQSYFDRDIINESLEKATVLKLNDEELPVVADILDIDRSSEAKAAAALTQRYKLHMIALTCGLDGSRIYCGSRLYRHSGFAAEVKDTVGAGDAFAAAVAAGLLQGRTPNEINENANRLASFVCSCHGATPILPDELAAILQI